MHSQLCALRQSIVQHLSRRPNSDRTISNSCESEHHFAWRDRRTAEMISIAFDPTEFSRQFADVFGIGGY